MANYMSIALISITAITAVYDVKTKKIPNKIILPAVLAAFLVNLLSWQLDHILVGLVSTIILITMYSLKKDLIGGGDVKLIIFIALMLGEEISNLIMIAAMYLIIVTAYYFVKQKIVKERELVPLALPLFLATVTYLIGV